MTHGVSRAATLAILPVLACLWPGPATAEQQTPVPVTLRVDPCVRTEVTAVDSVFSLELRTSARAVPASRRVQRDIVVTCDRGMAVLRVRDPATGRTLKRRISLSVTSRRGGARTIALAAVELLVTSWSSSAPDRPATARTRETPRAPADSLIAAATLTRESAWFATGVAVRWARDVSGGLGGAVDARLDLAREPVTAGSVRIWTTSVGATAHGYRRRGGVVMRAAAGVRVGVVRMSGEPVNPVTTEGDSVLGMVFGPLLRLGVSVPLGAMAGSVSAESGYHVMRVGGQVDGTREAEVSGPWVTLAVGIGGTW